MKRALLILLIGLSVLVYTATFAQAESESLEQLKFTCFAQTRFDAQIGENDEGDLELKSDSFGVSRVRIRATGKLVKTLGFFVQMDAGSNPAIKDARLRVGCPALPLTLEAGRFLLPFGVETPINPYWLTAVDYSLPVSKMMNGLWDVGVKIYGKPAISNQLSLDYAVAVVNGNTGGYSDDNKSKDFVGRIGVELPMGLSLGGSGYIGKASVEGVEDDVTKNRFGADIKLSSGPILLQAEGMLGTNDETDAMGLYVLAAFKVLPSIQLVGKFDLFDPDTDAEDGATNRIRVGANCFIAGNNQVQVFYQLTNNPDDTTAHNIIVQLAMVFDAG